MKTNIHLRLATIKDKQAIQNLISLSSHALSQADYTPAQIDAALKSALGLDSQLIKDQTYYVVVIKGGKKIIGCGGWSFRNTLFGNDTEKDRDNDKIDSTKGAAKIRAFFIHPDFARQGLASLILQTCESAAKKQGYSRFELMATLPGKKLYEQRGYTTTESINYTLTNHRHIQFVTMSKNSGI